MHDQINLFYVLALSVVLLLAWQYFFATSLLPSTARKIPPSGVSAPGLVIARPAPDSAKPAAIVTPAPMSRQQALAQSPRVAIETSRLRGSIALRGGRIDDLSLVQYRETIDPQSPAVVLLAPAGSRQPFYAEFGWIDGASGHQTLPGPGTVWRQQGSNPLAVGRPVILVWQSGEGLEFRRIISVDEQYLFEIRDEVVNTSAEAVVLAPYASIARQNPPTPPGNTLLHEGAIGVLGDQGLQELGYKVLDDRKRIRFDIADAWLGFTDKYWAAMLLPDSSAHLKAEFSAAGLGTPKTYRADYIEDARLVAPGASTSATTRLFAGAKEVAVLDAYGQALHLNRFDLAIDWGWFRFITRPMFSLIDAIFRLVGNFGVAMLAVTLMLKIAFFPLANKSYASGAKMRALQPQLQQIRDNFRDDRAGQQQAMMELYRKERINPIAGCLPMLIQIPVFLAFYWVLRDSVELRQAPFILWINDLSAKDPLFVLPAIMAAAMFIQYKINPQVGDPAQQKIFMIMPMAMSATFAFFPAGLVLYWVTNTVLSILQQWNINRRIEAAIKARR